MNAEWDQLFNQMKEWAQAVEQFTEHLQRIAVTQQPFNPSFSLAVWEPAVNVYETKEMVVVLVELAGVHQEDLTIEIDAEQIVIRGQRQEVLPKAAQTFHRMEIWSGAFAVQVPLPSTVDASQAQAHYRTGLLEIQVPKCTTTHPCPTPSRISLMQEEGE
jgi:HSP20 family protein